MKKIILSVTKGEGKAISDLTEANKVKIVKKYNSKCAACAIDISDYHHFHEETSNRI